MSLFNTQPTPSSRNSRHTLHPRLTSYRITKTRKTFIRFNRRDWDLTNDQYAWARSLAGSLSGWLNRTSYQRARELADRAHVEEVEALLRKKDEKKKEGEVKEEEEEEQWAAGAGLYAGMFEYDDDEEAGLCAEAHEYDEDEETNSPFGSTPDSGEFDEEDSPFGSTADPEKFEEKDSEAFDEEASDSDSFYLEEEDLSFEAKAAAWADKANQMHLGGMGSKIMTGWDPVRKTYIRNYGMEKCIARFKEVRGAVFDYHSSDEEESEESENDEGKDKDGEGEDIAPSSEVPTQPASASDTMDATQPHTSDTMDATQLHASDTMDATQPLTTEAPPTPSPTPPPAPAPVVDWRVKARLGVEKKKLSIMTEWSVLTWKQKSNINERYIVLEDDGVNIEPLRERKATSDEVTAMILARAAAYEHARTATDLPRFTPANGPEGRLQLGLQAADLRIVQASVGANPESPVDEDEDTTQPFSLTEPYRPQPSHVRKRKREHEDDTSNKKKKVEKKVSEDVLAAQTLEEMKQKRLRGVFRPARSAPGETDSISRVVFVLLGFGGHGVSLSKRGFDHVMNELRFLANADGAGGEVTLNDPDFDPESSGDLSGTGDGNDAMAGVTVTKQKLVYTVVQGETQVLAGLFEMLGEETLLHRTGWEWDGLRLQAAGGFIWTLSAETQGVMRDIEEMLRDGAVKVLVGVVPA
jgi:hypothetical protein